VSCVSVNSAKALLTHSEQRTHVNKPMNFFITESTPSQRPKQKRTLPRRSLKSARVTFLLFASGVLLKRVVWAGSKKDSSPNSHGQYKIVRQPIRMEAGSPRLDRHNRGYTQGSRLLRAILVETAWRLVLRTRRWSSVYEKLRARCGVKKAIVAVARRVWCVMVAMLQSGQRYQPA